ncbi:hypothetical protein JP75_05875 [Devosia riboflavina]|uniref:Uncharacterized protein n=1 Tax=Devosia riboflavina TaxID=46914 RepID=A0A087M4X2_9HYPH|nr:hypothetical protein JP75_05875 [Devosia riboflavina]
MKRRKPLPKFGIFCARLERPPFGVCGPDRRRKHPKMQRGLTAVWPVVGIHAFAQATPSKPDFPPGTSSVPRVIGGNGGMMAQVFGAGIS